MSDFNTLLSAYRARARQRQQVSALSEPKEVARHIHNGQDIIVIENSKNQIVRETAPSPAPPVFPQTFPNTLLEFLSEYENPFTVRDISFLTTTEHIHPRFNGCFNHFWYDPLLEDAFDEFQQMAMDMPEEYPFQNNWVPSKVSIDQNGKLHLHEPLNNVWNEALIQHITQAFETLYSLSGRIRSSFSGTTFWLGVSIKEAVSSRFTRIKKSCANLLIDVFDGRKADLSFLYVVEATGDNSINVRLDSGLPTRHPSYSTTVQQAEFRLTNHAVLLATKPLQIVEQIFNTPGRIVVLKFDIFWAEPPFFQGGLIVNMRHKCHQILIKWGKMTKAELNESLRIMVTEFLLGVLPKMHNA